MAVNDMVFSAKEVREFVCLNKKHGITFGEYISRKLPNELTEPEWANALLRACCKITGTEFTCALSRSRRRKDVLARQFAMYFLKEKLPAIFIETIGEYYCRDHSTVTHAIKEVKRLMNPKYKDPMRKTFFAAQKEIDMNLKLYVSR